MKKFIILLSMVLILTSYTLAFDVKTTFDTKDYVFEDPEPIPFTIDITNAEPGYYTVYTLADLYITPTGTHYISGDSKTLELSITPYERLSEEGALSFLYTIYQKDGDRRDFLETIEFYTLDSALKIETNDINFDDNKAELYITNLVNHNFENLTASFSSILFNVNKTFSLSKGETKEFELEIDPDILKVTKAGTYVIDSNFYVEDGISKVNGKLYLNETKGITSQEDKSGFFVRKQSITKINTGNSVERVNIEIQKNVFNRFLTSFNIKPESVTRNKGKIIYTWNPRIDPAEVFTVTAKTNYLNPIIIILLLIIAAKYLNKLLQQKLVVRKSVSPMTTKNGEFALKVQLNLKARKEIQDLNIVDKIPKTVKLYKKFKANEPNKIDVEKRTLSWDIEEMKAGEERILNYIIYSRVGFVGKFSLPKAKVKFVVDEKLVTEESNQVFFMSEQPKKD